MNNIFSRLYHSIKSTFDDICDAHRFKVNEYKFNAGRIDEAIGAYALESIKAKRKLVHEQELLEHLRGDVSNRYFTNIKRVLTGKTLIQNEEDKCGLKYNLTHSSKFAVVDMDKYNKINSDLESMISNSNSSNYSNKKFYSTDNDVLVKTVESADHNTSKSKSYDYSDKNYMGTLQEGCALYINSYKNDCYTNKIAKISSENSGSIKQIADSLSGYVSGGDVKIISPHKRSWASRVDNIEDLILKNNFSQSDKDKLSQIKEALSKNKYLTSKKKEQYHKINRLLDKAMRRAYA